MNKQLFVVCLALIAAGAALNAQAQDVPPYLSSQGRLFDAQNAPLTGVETVTFALYDSEDPTATALWTETQTVSLSDGYYSVILGQGTPIDPAQFSGVQLFLGVAVGADPELAPRLPVNSVPYAIKSGTSQNATTAATATTALTAETAENVTGDITPNSVTVGGTVIDSAGVTVNGTTIIDGSGAWSGPAPVADYNTILNPPFTFDNLSCTDGQIPQQVGGVWTCVLPPSDLLSGLLCADGQVVKFSGGTWACADDLDTSTTYTATPAGGVIIGAANDISADTAIVQARVFGTCSAGFSIRQVNVDGSVVCEDDSNTTYSADPTGGLILSGTNAFGIAANAIDSSRIADGTITSADILDATITSADIANATIANADLAADSVGSANIINGTITSADILDATITSTDILDSTVTSADLADGTVASIDIADSTVTSADIAANTIVAADVNNTSIQLRVTGTCGVGSFISAIAADGTVTCTNTVTTAAALACPPTWRSAAGGRVCQDTTVRNGNIHAAIAFCTSLEARVCTHNDMQQLCGTGANPYNGATPSGWYGDHARVETTGNTDDEYLTWNRNTCDPNNDGPAADSATVQDYFCCR